MLVEDHWKVRPGRALAKANGVSSFRPIAWMESWRGGGGGGCEGVGEGEKVRV